MFHLDWSKFTVSSVESFEKGVTRYLKEYATFLGINLPDDSTVGYSFERLVNACLEKLSDDSILAQKPKLLDGAIPICRDKVVLLIDEYDAPLSRNLDDTPLVDSLRKVYTEFFSTIKRLTCFRFVFITGVTSYSQNSIFSEPNQFENISFSDEYATCCGYTKDELEYYFAPEIKRAQDVCGLSHDELLNALGSHYYGYTYSKLDPDKKRVFSPVSVSLYLNRPEKGFYNYWAKTGGSSDFLFKLIRSCNRTIAKQLLQRLYPSLDGPKPKVIAALEDIIDSCHPFFSLAIDSADTKQPYSQLLEINLCDLLIDTDDTENLIEDNAIAILFQSGYLSIKKVDDTTAYLGFPNLDVARALARLLQDQLEDQEEDEKTLCAADQHILYFLANSEEVLDRIYQGGQTLCDLINDTYYFIDKKIFKLKNADELLCLILFLMLKVTGYNTSREVKSMFGTDNIVIYKPNTPHEPDVVLEFKLAQRKDKIVKLLEDGTKQVADRKYSADFLNSDPLLYCIVLSHVLQGVGAISRVHRYGTYTTEYKCPQLGAHGKAPIK